MSATTQPAAETTPAPDTFLEAFDRLSELADDAPATDVAAAATAGTESQDTTAPAAETVAGAPEGEDTAAETVAGAEGEDTAAPAAESEEQEPPETDDDLLKRLSALVRKAPAAEPEPTPPARAAEPAEEVQIYTPEEQKILEDYVKDWPDVAKAERLARRAEYRQLVDFVFKEVAGYLRPVVEQVEVVATRTHLADLQSKVTDYDDVRDKVIGWVKEQPKYLRTAYESVITEGTADEVADLVSRWRAETGATVSKPTTFSKRQSETALPPAAKQAAAALAPVGSKRSAPSAGIDPGDFQGAFEMFAADKA
jgi:hypothetical protein